MKNRLTLTFAFITLAILSICLTSSCKKDENNFVPELNIKKTSIYLSDTANSTDTFSIVSNTNWTVESTADWLNLDPASGSDNQTVTITAEKNNTISARTATIIISTEGVDTKTLSVTQFGTLTALPAEMHIGASENSMDTFTISSDTNWTVTSSDSWLMVNPKTGAGNDTIQVTAQENTAIEERTATVTISTATGQKQHVTVKQSGALLISRKSLNMPSQVNSTDTFQVSSSVNWTISSDVDWLKVSPESGSGNQIITVTTTEPVTISRDRSTNLTISTEKNAAQSVKITQIGIPCASEAEDYCEVHGCSVLEIPSYSSLPTNSYLPDPFTFMDGTQVTSASDWTCRRHEIAVLAQEFQYGYKPCTPKSATTASFEDNTLTVTVSDNGKTISFDCSITYPGSGSGPYPAMIGIGFSFLNNQLLSDLGVAVINFPNDQIAEQNNSGSRGKGKFYDFFCSDHSAGALMAWSWGVSRLIDALEKAPEANIDAGRLGVTGCSRNGKGALCAGAFDERVLLTIPQESGSGGAASWRVSDYMLNQGQSTQTLQQIVGENCWFRLNFSQFSRSVNKLPIDQHLVKGLIAPRALLVIENEILWLGPESSWNSANAAHTIWEALGIPEKMGYSGTTGHNHCALPSSQNEELSAYVQNYLVGDGNANTGIMQSEPGHNFNKEQWVNWEVPELE